MTCQVTSGEKNYQIGGSASQKYTLLAVLIRKTVDSQDDL